VGSHYLKRLCVFVIISKILLTANLFGYIDPGTGSYLLQILLAGLLGAAFAIKMFWQNIKNFFKKLFNKEESE